LLATEGGLDKVKGPILFPVYGRGRAFPALYNENLSSEFVSKTSEFLCRKCACEVKEMAPGVDLIFATDWKATFDKLFVDAEAPSVAMVQIGRTGAAPDQQHPGVTFVTPTPFTPEPMPFTPMPTVVEATPSDCMFCRNWLWFATGFAGVLVLATGAWAGLSMRK
jgi:hypothetical protein